MKKCGVLCLGLLLVFIFFLAVLDADEELFRISKLTETLHKIEYSPSYNFVHLASVGKNGILLIDTGLEEIAPALLDALKGLGNGQVSLVINTHAHADHIGGNPVFAEAAQVIAHTNVKKRYSPPFYHLPPIKKGGAPNITFSDTVSLFFNGESVIVRSMPPGHSDGDVLVYFPDSHILYMGDLVIHGRFSTVDLSLGGDVDGFISNLSTLITDYPDETRFFPSHGPEFRKQDLIAYRQAFVETLPSVERELKQGKTVDDIVNGYVFNGYQDWLRKADWVEVIRARKGNKAPPSICETLTRVLVGEGRDNAIKTYFDLKTNSPDKYLFTENQLNALGYQLLARDMVDDAVAFFELNAAEHPESANAYDSLGEAYVRQGELQLAEHNFMKALQIDSGNIYAKEHLEQLRKEKIEHGWQRKSESGNGYAITGVAVVDVERGQIIPDQTIVVIEDRIVRIAPQSEVSVRGGAEVIDGEGMYLMPGLVDAHVHYFDQDTFGRLLVGNGILLIRDMGSPNLLAIGLRKKLNEEQVLGPEMVTTGSMLDGDPPYIPSIAFACKTPEEGREKVRLQARVGVDQIKLYSNLEKDVFMAIVDEANKLGLKPVGHVPEAVYLVDAAEAGQKSCEHMFGFGKVIAKLLDEQVELKVGGMGTDVPYFSRWTEVDRKKLQSVLHRVRDCGMAVCPTIVVMKHGAHLKEIMAGDYPNLEYASPMIRDIWKSMWNPDQEGPDVAGETWPHMQSFVAELHRAGVPLLAGTDLLFPGIIAGFSLHEEMFIWQEAGIPPADVLRYATILPAKFVGLDNRLGTVSEGKTASLVLTRANPLEDIRNASQIEGVFLRGRYFSRADLDGLLREAKEICRQ